MALLEWLLEVTVIGPELPALLEGRTPGERMLSAIRRDVERLPRQRERVELFFGFWVMGTRHGEVQRMIRAALDFPIFCWYMSEIRTRFARMGTLAP